MSRRNPLSTLLERIVVSQTEKPWLFLIGAALITAAAAVFACNLRLDPSLESMLPQDSPELQNLRSVREKTGGTQQLVVAIGGGTIEQRMQHGRELVPALREIDGVRSVELELPVGFLRDRALWLVDGEGLEEIVAAAERTAQHMRRETGDSDASAMALLGQRFMALIDDQQGALPQGNVLTSQDGEDLYIVVTPAVSLSDLSEGRRLMGAIDETISSLSPGDSGLDVRTVGLLRLYQDQHRILSADLRNASIIALVLGIIIVAAACRRLRFPVIIGVSLLPGIVWTFALVSMVQSEINVITGFMVAVLIGLGIDHGVHLVIRFQQEMARLKTCREALVATMLGTLPPALTSALTTAATFCCLLVADFPGFTELGGVAATGVMLTLLSTVLILPPLLFVWKGTPAKVKAESPVSAGAPRSTLARAIPRVIAAPVVVLFVGAACVGVGDASRIPFRNDFREMRGESAANDLYDEVSKSLGGGFSPAVVIVESLDDATLAAEIIRRDDSGSEREMIAVGKVLSASDLVPHDVEKQRMLIGRLKTVIDDPELQQHVAGLDPRVVEGLAQVRQMTAAEAWGFEDVPVEFRRRLTTLDGEEHLVLFWPAERTDSDARKRAWERELRALSTALDDAGIQHQIADEMLINGWVSDLVLRERTRVLPLAAAVVFVILLVDLRSFRRALLVMTPLAVGILSFFAVLHMLGLELNLFNMIVIPCIIGLGIDSAVHIFHRYRAAGRGSIMFVMRNTGVAITVAALTTAVGFGSSLVSHQPGLRSLGLTSIIGIGVVFAAATIFFPAFIILLEGLASVVRRLRERRNQHTGPNNAQLVTSLAEPSTVSVAQDCVLSMPAWQHREVPVSSPGGPSGDLMLTEVLRDVDDVCAVLRSVEEVEPCRVRGRRRVEGEVCEVGACPTGLDDIIGVHARIGVLAWKEHEETLFTESVDHTPEDHSR